ncbi:Uncharacterised protein [uncultured archaeon]|nr:Uncharacterised protein [uncultured archaeon]
MLACPLFSSTSESTEYTNAMSSPSFFIPASTRPEFWSYFADLTLTLLLSEYEIAARSPSAAADSESESLDEPYFTAALAEIEPSGAEERSSAYSLPWDSPFSKSDGSSVPNDLKPWPSTMMSSLRV